MQVHRRRRRRAVGRSAPRPKLLRYAYGREPRRWLDRSGGRSHARRRASSARRTAHVLHDYGCRLPRCIVFGSSEIPTEHLWMGLTRDGIGGRQHDDRGMRWVAQIQECAGFAVVVAHHQAESELHPCGAYARVASDAPLHVESIVGIVQIDVLRVVVQCLEKHGKIIRGLTGIGPVDRRETRSSKLLASRYAAFRCARLFSGARHDRCSGLWISGDADTRARAIGRTP